MQHEILKVWENAVLQSHQAAVVEDLVNMAVVRITISLGVILAARYSLDGTQGLGGEVLPISSMCDLPPVEYSVM